MELIDQAHAITKINLIANVTKAAVTDWRAATWLLERSFPEEYGNRENREITGKDQGLIEIQGALPFVVNLITEGEAGDRGDMRIRGPRP